eukprot:2663551-Pleurochrysis_carterae.AAC.2
MAGADWEGVQSELLAAVGLHTSNAYSSLFSLGLVSVQTAALLARAKNLLGANISESILLKKDTINDLAEHIVQRLKKSTDAESSSQCVNIRPSSLPRPLVGQSDRVFLADTNTGSISVRLATEDDIATLLQLEAERWSGNMAMSAPDILFRIRSFPQGQLVLEEDGRTVIGSLWTQRIASSEQLRAGITFREALDLHEDSGPVWQLIAVQVAAAQGPRGLGDLIINYALSVASLTEGVNEVVAITRCRNWNSDAGISMEEYLSGEIDP